MTNSALDIRLLWIADYKREFRNNIELPDARGQFERLRAGELLVHFAQVIRLRFGMLIDGWCPRRPTANRAFVV